MSKGTVKWYNATKGYGFITDDDGADFFVHIKDVYNAAVLENGAAVTFDPVDGTRGPAAENVTVLEVAV